MKKILNNLESSKETFLAEVISNKEIINALREYGYDLNPKWKKDYDFVFTMSDRLNDRFLNSHHDIICFERVDGSRIYRRQALKHPNLKFLAKMHYLVGSAQNNLPCIDERVFTRQLDTNPLSWAQLNPQLTEGDCGKIRQGPSFWYFKKFDFLCELMKKTEVKLIKDRQFDIFFAGTTKYESPGYRTGELVTRHRRQCVEACRKMKCSGVAHGEKTYPLEAYYTMLLDTKYAVSPWGWGEVCHRDYEALMCGCILIRPFLDYRMLTLPSIMPYGLFCKPDFSDLESIIKSRSAGRLLTERERSEWINMRHPERVVEDLLLPMLEEGGGES